MTTLPAAVARFLPSPDGPLPPLVVDRGLFRRDLDLRDHAPAEVHRLAALVLDARALVRERWSQRTELSPRAYAALRARPLPTPRDFLAGSFQCVADAGAEARCSGCPIRLGRGPCAACGGTGTRFTRDPGDAESVRTEPCPACDGGFAQCSFCEGGGVTVTATVLYAEDQVVRRRWTFLPDVAPGLAAALAAALPADEAQPEALAFALEPTELQGPYRGATGTREPDAHGFAFGRAFARARDAAAEVTGSPGVMLARVTACARPFLWLRYVVDGGRHEAAVFARPDGALAGVTAAP